MERSEEGILLMQLHNGEGGEFEWSFDNHHEVGFSWRDVGADAEKKLIILTGSADAFLRREYLRSTRSTARAWTTRQARRRVDRCARPRQATRVRSARDRAADDRRAQRPVTIHAEIPLLCDIILAAEHTVIADHVHFNFGLVPGDGVQTVSRCSWGSTARATSCSPARSSTRKAPRLGPVNEVLPRRRSSRAPTSSHGRSCSRRR